MTAIYLIGGLFFLGLGLILYIAITVALRDPLHGVPTGDETDSDVDQKRDLSAKLDRLWLRFVVPVGLLGLGIYLILPNGS